MKKMFLSFVLLIISLSLFGQTATPPAIGDGTVGSPFEIETLDNLYWLSQNPTHWDKFYTQTADIEAYSTSAWDSGLGFSPIGIAPAFTGSYDGKHHTINELYISRGADPKVGFFGEISSATIQNLGLTNVSIQGSERTGGLVGIATNSSTIQNCYVEGSIVSNSSNVGGLIGELTNSSVNKCYTSGSVNGFQTVGGLIGYTENSTIDDSYSLSSLHQDCYANVGGLIGGNSLSIVNNCYSAGPINVLSGEYISGFIGWGSEAHVTNSFWDVDASGKTTSSGGGTGKTTAEMKDVTTYTSLSSIGLDSPWDFVGNPYDDVANEDIWAIEPTTNNGYPFLQWQTEEPLPLPQNLQAGNWNNHVILYWNIPIDEGFTILGYNVYDYNVSNGQSTKLNADLIEDLEFYHFADMMEFSYTYHVKAEYPEGESVAAEVNVYTSGPAAPSPRNLESEPSSNRARIFWDEPVEDLPLQLIRYDVYRNTYFVTSIDNTHTEYIDNDVSNGQSYFYQVYAVYKYDIVSNPTSRNVYVHPTPWNYGPGDLVETSMSIDGELHVDDVVNYSDVYWIGTFRTGQETYCRGLIQNSDYGYSVGAYGNLIENGEQFHIKVYNETTDTEYDLAATFLFQGNTSPTIDSYIYTTTQYTLNLSKNGFGTIVPAAGQYVYPENAEVTINANPASGWQFDKWVINGVTHLTPQLTITMTENINAEAHFIPITYDLTITKNGEGTTTPEEGVHSYNHGQTVQLSATPSYNYVFDKWVIGSTEYFSRNVSFVISGNTEATVYFSPKPVTYISVNPNTYMLEAPPATNQLFTIEATIYPTTAFNQEVFWMSDNPDIAIVQQTNQLQTTVTIQQNAPYGVAEITVISSDGALMATCDVIIIQTTVGQGTVPEVFTASQHPYLIQSNIDLNNRTTTTIENGVMMFFGGDFSLNVNSQLIAEDVTFAGTASRERNRWLGVRINESTSNINGSSILNAIQPLQLNNSNVGINNLFIDGGDFDNPMDAVEINGNSSPVIGDLNIINYAKGIRIENDTLTRSTPTITNTRVRSSAVSSRTGTYGIQVDGPVSVEIGDNTRVLREEEYDIEIDGFATGIAISDATESTSTPVITNTRVRSSAVSSRQLGDSGIKIDGPVAVAIGKSIETERDTIYYDIEIDGYETGIDINNSTNFASTPVITNTRVRNSAVSSRQLLTGLKLNGAVSLQLSDSEIEDTHYGIHFKGTGEELRSTPVITNTRVRNSAVSSRIDNIGMYLQNVYAIEIGAAERNTEEDVLIEDYTTGIQVDSVQTSSTPVITNTRVRNSAVSSRAVTYGIKAAPNAAPQIDNCNFENLQYGIFMDGTESETRSTPVITNTRVRNSAVSSRTEDSGMSFLNISYLEMDNCEVEDFQTGIKIINTGRNRSTPVITNTRVRNSSVTNRSFSKGIVIMGQNNGQIINNEIIGADSAIVISGAETLPIIRENLLHFNHVADEGVSPVGIYANVPVASQSLVIRKNTIYGYPIGLITDGTDINFNSNVTWNDIPTQEPIVNNGGILTLQYSNIARPDAAIQPGTGNINQPPLFRSPYHGQFQFVSGSPCIDSGDSGIANDPDGSRADMGKYYEPVLDDFYAVNPFGVAPHTVQFMDISYGFTGAQISWDMDNDGTYDVTGKNAQYTYDAPGVYSVKVRVTKPGLLDTMTKEKLIVIQGTALPAVENFSIQIVGNDVHLAWDALSTRKIRQSKDRNLYYLIYISRFPDKQFAFLNFSAAGVTTYTHENVLDMEDRAFYQIIGFEGTLRELERFINTQTKYRPLQSKNAARRTKK